MQPEAIAKVNDTIERAEKIWGRAFPRPRVSFELRGTKAGTYSHGENVIRLNRTLLLENGQAFIDRTPGHEAAHLITRHVYGAFVSHHGPEWKSVMRRLGFPPVRCHSFDVTNAKVRNVQKFSYFCRCQEIKVGAAVNAKIQRGVVYRCRKCKTPIASQGASMQLTSRRLGGVSIE
jgi:SprT protein